jgi:hypothetical protein
MRRTTGSALPETDAMLPSNWFGTH